MMKKQIAEISGTFQNAIKSAIKVIHIDTWIASFCVISLLIITILQVTTGRSESELYLCFLMPVIACIGCLTILIRKVKFRFNWIDTLVAGWFVYVMLRLWIDATFPVSSFVLRATLMFALYLSTRLLFSGCRQSGNFIAVFLIIFSIVEALMGYSQLISGASRHHLYPVTGSFLNPGPYSVYLTLGVVSAMALRNLKDFRWLAIMLLAVPLVLTMSRAAFLAILVCGLIIYRRLIKGWKQWVVLVALATILAGCLYALKAGSADGRGIINYIGIHCFIDNPLLGSGIGSFFNCFATKTAEIGMKNPGIDLSSVDVIDYAFNDFLLVGVEQGVIGLAFAIGISVPVLYRLWHGCLPLFYAAMSLLIIAFFSYPFEMLPYQIIAVILTSYASGLVETKSVATSFSRIKGAFSAIALILLSCRLSFLCYCEIRERLVAEKEFRMLAGVHDKAFIKDYYEILPLLEDNKRFLFDFAKLLSEQGRYNDSNDMLRRGALISNDPMFLVLQGNNYRDLGAYELAEQTYLLARYTMPNRIYPLYRLMKLHELNGNPDKAKEYAEKIICFKEKVPSPAVNDMKKEAQEIFNRKKINYKE